MTIDADHDRTGPADAMSVTSRIPAPPDTLFAVLADPRTHAGVHGDTGGEGPDAGRIGRVDGAVDTEPLTRNGQRFRMAMYHEAHPDKAYQTVNEVLVHEFPSAIAWRTGYLDDDGVVRFGGWLWRYDLVPSDGGTDVTLTYDWSAATQEVREVIQFPPFGPELLQRSLGHLAELACRTEAAQPTDDSATSGD